MELTILSQITISSDFDTLGVRDVAWIVCPDNNNGYVLWFFAQLSKKLRINKSTAEKPILSNDVWHIKIFLYSEWVNDYFKSSSDEYYSSGSLLNITE